MFRGRVLLARVRGRSRRRLDRNRRLGETFLPAGWMLRRDTLPPMPPARDAARRTAPAGARSATATLDRPSGGRRVDDPTDRPPQRESDTVDRPADRAVDGDGEGVDRPDGAVDDDADGGVDRGRPGPGSAHGGRGSLLPPRPERPDHDWDEGPPALGERRPVVPGWVRDPAPTLRWWVGEQWHRVRFHGFRAPVYGWRAVAWTPRGLVRVVVGLWRFCTDAEGRELRWYSVEQYDVQAYLYLSRQRNERVRIRGAAVAALVAVVLVAVVVGWMDPAGRALVVVALVAVGGWFGRPVDRPLFDHHVVPPSGVRITPDLLVEAYCAAKLCNKHDDPDRHQTIAFVQPVHRDGKGWRAVFDLPGGHTASQAVARTEKVAAGLGVDEVRVFIDRVRGDDGSARRVSMWVADKDPYGAAPTPSPLIEARRWNFWDGAPFGTDARGRLVRLFMLFTSLLTGAIPRMGKTYVARLVVAAAALDPLVRLINFDGKGGADWRPGAKVAYRCGFGARDAVVAHLAEVLGECETDMERRYDTLGELPHEVCPESKITPAICANRRLNMFPVLITIDEIQEYLGHATHGAVILERLVRLAKVGPAVGYMLNIATQRPSTEVIPADLRDNIGTRFALKTMTWQNSDAILGAGAYSAGLDASRFLRSHKAVGILLGADDGDLADEGPRTVRGHLLDLAGFDAICDRGRALRQAAGTLEGAAAGEQVFDDTPRRSVLDDVAACFGAGETKLWSETICARLVAEHPETYSGWGPNELAVALAPHGVDTAQVWGRDDAGVGRNRRGVDRQAVLAATAAHATPSSGPAAPAGGRQPLAPRAPLAPDPARSSTPSSDPDQATSGLAAPTESPDTPHDRDSGPGPLAARDPDPADNDGHDQ